MLGKWRFFLVADLTPALEWAARGNVAVHDAGVPFKQYPSCAHVFVQNGEALTELAAELNLGLQWIQHGSTHPYYTTHFTVFGAKLKAALTRCRRDVEPAPSPDAVLTSDGSAQSRRPQE